MTVAETATQAIGDALLAILAFGGTSVLFLMACEAIKRGWEDSHAPKD